MIRSFTLTLIAAAILLSHSDTYAMSGHGKRGGGKNSSDSVQTESVTTYSWGEYSSQSYSRVPEVGTVVLLVSGVAGLALWVRRRK